METEKPEYKFRGKDFVPARGWMTYAARNAVGTPYFGKNETVIRTAILWPYHFGLTMPVGLILTGIDGLKGLKRRLENKALKK